MTLGPESGMRASGRFARGVLLIVILAALAAWVWPTVWRYDKITIDRDTYPVRIHRITGRAYILLPGDGWTPAEDVDRGDGNSDEDPGTRT